MRSVVLVGLTPLLALLVAPWWPGVWYPVLALLVLWLVGLLWRLIRLMRFR